MTGITPQNAFAKMQQAARSGNFQWTPHALQRMRERGITTRQVTDCLRLGQMDGLPELDDKGLYRCKAKRRVAGDTIVAVASVWPQANGDVAIVITAFEQT